MSLNTEELQQIAHLARLELQREQVPSYARQLSDILALVNQLTSSDTVGVEAMAHPLGMTQRLRPDIVSEVVQRDLFQAVAPAVEAGLYLVPKVIE